MKKPDFRLYRWEGKEVPTLWFYFRNILIGLVIIGLVVLYSKEFQYFTNTFNFRSLLWKALVAGGLTGLAVGYFFQRKAVQPLEKVQIMIFFILIFLIFAPMLGSLSNRWLHFGKTEARNYPFYQLEMFISDRFGMIKGESPTPTGYYLFFIKDNRIVRITTHDTRFERNQKGDTIALNIRKGLWGYEWCAGN